MSELNVKKSLFSKIRNNFIAGIVVLIPIGITLYLTLFLIRISGKLFQKKLTLIIICLLIFLVLK